MNVLIILSTYYEDIAKNILSGAIEEAQKYHWNIRVIKVLGALEIPIALSLFLKNHHCDGVITLGCVIRGETDHYQHVSRCSLEHVIALCCQNALPLGQGILTVHNRQQAHARLGGKYHAGKHAVRSCKHLMQLGF